MHLVLDQVPTIASAAPTVWGLGPVELHDHFWAARGVHVVRQGETAELAANAELFLLTDPRTLAIFRLRKLIETLSWSRPDVLFLRLHNSRENGYRESVITDDAGSFLRFQRSYGGFDSRLARVALTRSPQVARLWRDAPDAATGWRRLRRCVQRRKRQTMTIAARAYDRTADEELARFVRDLVQSWNSPAATIGGISRLQSGVWAHGDVQVSPGTRFIGPVWIGAGRSVEGIGSILGPAALWDDPAARPARNGVRWEQIEPTEAFLSPLPQRRPSSLYQASKRLFDIVFALIVLALTLPLYPLVMLAIWLEDGRPFFFTHQRETTRGRSFRCLKFRSMRKDADAIKACLRQENQSDGPQFFIEDDPRLTHVGRVIRKLNIDELPQFFNVLLGQMSVVGPRPSPYSENQFCPPWREARLSVRPGITGLWQVMRTRTRGLDFQEWIKFDLEYVANAGWRLDLLIIGRTLLVLARGLFRS